MHLLTALGLLLAVPALIAYVQEEKDATIRTLSGGGMILGAWYALWPVVHQLREIAPRFGTLDVIIGVATAVFGLLLVLRVKNLVVGTLACCSGSLLCLLALRAIH